jgi:hypothetical protein
MKNSLLKLTFLGLMLGGMTAFGQITTLPVIDGDGADAAGVMLRFLVFQLLLMLPILKVHRTLAVLFRYYGQLIVFIIW